MVTHARAGPRPGNEFTRGSALIISLINTAAIKECAAGRGKAPRATQKLETGAREGRGVARGAELLKGAIVASV